MAKYVDHRLNMNERALVVVMQFLKDSGFEQTLEALEAERYNQTFSSLHEFNTPICLLSKKSIDENPCGQPNVLISALTVYDEHLTAQKKDSTADDVEEALVLLCHMVNFCSAGRVAEKETRRQRGACD